MNLSSLVVVSGTIPVHKRTISIRSQHLVNRRDDNNHGLNFPAEIQLTSRRQIAVVRRPAINIRSSIQPYQRQKWNDVIGARPDPGTEVGTLSGLCDTVHMPAYASFFRAINLGSYNKIPMAKLKALHEDLGFENVSTYVQSGNVVFTAKAADTAKLEKQIMAKLGGDIVVVVRNVKDMRDVVKKNPFPDRATSDPGLLVVIFLATPPTAAAKKSLLEVNVGPEEKAFAGRELYVFYAAGQGRSKLGNALIEKKLGVRGTARNWNTVTRVLEMAESVEG